MEDSTSTAVPVLITMAQEKGGSSGGRGSFETVQASRDCGLCAAMPGHVEAQLSGHTFIHAVDSKAMAGRQNVKDGDSKPC